MLAIMTHATRFTPTLTSLPLMLFGALLMGCSEDSPEPIDLIIANATLVDAMNPIRANQTVLIDQGRILNI